MSGNTAEIGTTPITIVMHQWTDPVNSNIGFGHALRGGCVVNGPFHVRSAQRNTVQPDYSDFNLGFRVVRLLPSLQEPKKTPSGQGGWPSHNVEWHQFTERKTHASCSSPWQLCSQRRQVADKRHTVLYQ